MYTNVRYILLTALRDWLFAVLMIGVIAGALIAHLLGSTALIETQEMALSFTSASARVVVITGLIIFTCFHVRNAFDTKEIDVFLSRPITRSNLVFSYWIGFATVVVLLILPTILLVGLQGLINPRGFFFWSLSLLIEGWLVVAISLFAAFTLRSAVASTLLSMGFYVFARLMGFFVAMTQSLPVSGTQPLHPLLAPALKVVSAVMPRLDSFARSDWLIYGVRDFSEFKVFTLQALVFIPFLIFATIVDFQRKEF